MTSQFRGPYICTAINDVGETHRTIVLDMNCMWRLTGLIHPLYIEFGTDIFSSCFFLAVPPEMSANPATVKQKLGYEARLICHVNAKPEAAVTWFENDDEITVDK
jgi:hypothetical protein